MIDVSHYTVSVSDLGRSVSFYRDVLGLNYHHSGEYYAYLTAGNFWITLFLEKINPGPVSSYSHFAFSVSSSEFSDLCRKIIESGAAIWQENQSEGESLYFCDPDGNQLELHVGDLNTRLTSINSASIRQI